MREQRSDGNTEKLESEIKINIETAVKKKTQERANVIFTQRHFTRSSCEDKLQEHLFTTQAESVTQTHTHTLTA